MGIGKRISRIIKSNVNDILSAAENPDKQLDLLISEMEDSLRQAKQQLVEQMALEKRLQRQLDEADELVTLWAGKAQKAVDLGEDELARQALRKKKTYEELAGDYDRQLYEQQTAVDDLRQQYKLLEQRLQESRQRKGKISRELRNREATSSSSVHSDSSALRNTSAFDKFSEMADKVDALEAETQARAELEEMLEPDDNLAQKIDDATRTKGPDPELEALRQRASSGERLSRRRSSRESEDAVEEPPSGERLSRRRSREERKLEAEEPEERKRPAPDDDDDGGSGGDDGGWGRRVEL